ncbi:hypothetical protein GQ457_05G007530 [Hibiscus cannabinus]
MFIPHGTSDKPGGCCCINIYTNNNLQGSNGSVLVGSNIKMKNPGVHLYFGDLKFGEGSLITRRPTGSTLDFGSIFLFVFVSIILTLLLSYMLL